MKKLLIVLTLLLSINTYVAAQNYTEVVYLKNGSVIKGMIVEQIPNVSLKVQTPDGSVIICQMNDVERITKEEHNVKDLRKKSRSTLRGYKGFVDFGCVVDLSDYNANKVEISTSHGYQFNNYFYLGGGMAASIYTDLDLVTIPIFVDFRANFINKKITPFADVKGGYSVGDVEGGYATVGVGVRFSLKGKKALNLKMEYNFQSYDVSEDRWYGSHYYYYDDYYDLQGLGFKIGFEF